MIATVVLMYTQTHFSFTLQVISSHLLFQATAREQSLKEQERRNTLTVSEAGKNFFYPFW